MKEKLAVWLRGRHIADVDEPSPFRNRLTFTPWALQTLGVGSRALSLSMPVSDRALRDTTDRPVVRSWLDGLLPEGQLRQQLAASLRVSTIDVMSLLCLVGAECAGAVQFLPEGQEPATGWLRPLGFEEVNRIVEALPTYAAPDGGLPHASLAGLQDKVLLAWTSAGWAWPEDGAPSTHLVKPEPLTGVVNHLVAAEQWALDVARSAGLAAVDSRLEWFGQRRAIVIRRYDRDDTACRIHQEDFCQALGVPPEAKYEEGGTGRLKTIASLAAPLSADPAGFREELLKQVCFNVLIGNTDAHSKNYSILLDPAGQTSLAPLYDAAPLFYLSDNLRSTGQSINGRTRLRDVVVSDLIAEAETWGMRSSSARRVIDELAVGVKESLQLVPEPQELPGLSESVAAGLNSVMRS